MQLSAPSKTKEVTVGVETGADHIIELSARKVASSGRVKVETYLNIYDSAGRFIKTYATAFKRPSVIFMGGTRLFVVDTDVILSGDLADVVMESR